MSKTPLRRLGHFTTEHLTWLSVCGLVAIITGFTPEEWVAHLAEKLRVSSSVAGHWPQYLDIRAVLVAVGVVVIIIDWKWTTWKRNRMLAAAHAVAAQPPTTGSATPDISEAGKSFSDGDWITAAIVAPERAVTAMKKVGAGLYDQLGGNRNDVVGRIQAAVDQEVSRLRSRFDAGGTTDEARCEACIAKMTADLIEREGSSLVFELRQQPTADAKAAFSRMIKRLGKTG